jgi:hypothetical protein
VEVTGQSWATKLTAPWRFETFLYSIIRFKKLNQVVLKNCRVLKLADKPSCLGGGEKRINAR